MTAQTAPQGRVIRSGSRTPWGAADYVERVAGSGIYFAGTPSHGGYYVPDSMLASIPEAYQARALRWSGSRNWYEEDCEWASVAVSFPALFTAEQLERARKVIEWREQSERDPGIQST